MPDKLFSIGEIAKLKGFTVKALRFYEKIGLLKPHYVDSSTGYRYYCVEQLVRMDIIKAARAMGISPNDLKKVMEKADTKELLEFLDAQKEEAERKIRALQRAALSLSSVGSKIAYGIRSAGSDGISLRQIPLRRVVTLDYTEVARPEDAVMEYSKFDKILYDNRLVSTYETGIIFEPDSEARFVPAKIYNGVDTLDDSKTAMVHAIQAGTYACISYTQETALERTAKIMEYLEERKAEPVLILQVELLNNVFSLSGIAVELQVLIDA